MGALFAILAGGRGTRLGGDKASVELGGRPLISYPVGAAVGAAGPGDGLVVVAKRETILPELGVVVLREPAEPVHPLAGIVAALREAGGSAVVAVAADLPFVTPELLAWLAARDEPLVVPEHGGRLHPLLARYDGSLLVPLEEALRNEAALQETVLDLGPETLSAGALGRFGDPGRLLFNVNTLEDLARAEGLLGR
jgi:molybdopterin-guanine dinucleotide biosynthesis protein A